MKSFLMLATSLIIMSCSGINNTKQMNTLPDVLQMGQSILSRDTVEQVDYPTLTHDQCIVLRQQTSLDVPDNTQLIGVRPAGDKKSLDALKVPTGDDPNQFKVYLLTHSDKGVFIDAIDLGEFHTSEHQGPMRLGGNRFYTTDAELRFDGPDHFTLHRVMTLTSLYLKDHSLTEAWRVEWDNLYEITADGHFQFKGQQETYRSNNIDDPIIDDFKSRDRQSQ
jgi:hypothetical protein